MPLRGGERTPALCTPRGQTAQHSADPAELQPPQPAAFQQQHRRQPCQGRKFQMQIKEWKSGFIEHDGSFTADSEFSILVRPFLLSWPVSMLHHCCWWSVLQNAAHPHGGFLEKLEYDPEFLTFYSWLGAHQSKDNNLFVLYKKRVCLFPKRLGELIGTLAVFILLSVVQLLQSTLQLLPVVKQSYLMWVCEENLKYQIRSKY